MLLQALNSQANLAATDAPWVAIQSSGTPCKAKPADSRHKNLKRTLRSFEGLGIAVFPARKGTKGTYVAGWPEMTVAETRAELDRGPVNLAARTGDGWAVIDLDSKNGADAERMLALLRWRLGLSVLAAWLSSGDVLRLLISK